MGKRKCDIKKNDKIHVKKLETAKKHGYIIMVYQEIIMQERSIMAQKVPSVVTDLYRISNKLGPQAAVDLEQQNEAAAEAAVAEEKKDHHLMSELADAHLKRRYGDFQRSRSDMLDRLSTMESRLSAEENELQRRLQIVRTAVQEVRQLQAGIPADDPGKEAFSNRVELTDLTLKIEQQRIEMMRLLPIVEGASEKKRSMENGAGRINSKSEPGIILDSLGFRQILRLAFAVCLPIILALLVTSAIIAFAVIGSFKGLF